MKKILIVSTVVLFVAITLLSSKVASEHYEETSVRTRYGTPYILELGDRPGGTILTVRYNVTSSWLGGDEKKFRMSIVRSGETVYFIDGKMGQVTYIAKEPGNFSIRWASTYSFGQDWKEFDYWVDVNETPETESIDFNIVNQFNPIEFQRGSNGTIQCEIYNINQWPVMIHSLDLTLDIQTDEISYDADDEVIEPGSSSMFNITIPIASDEVIGTTNMELKIDLSMEVYGSWYEDLEWENTNMTGPTIVEKDSDGDLSPDNVDLFPNDPLEMYDSDEDGVGNHADAFPFDPTETTDSDNDTVGDNSDAFPNDATEWSDMDGDGVGDNADAFPKDAAASKDTDNDGYPDEWNSGKTELDSPNGLVLDQYPSDSEKWKKPKDSPFLPLSILIAVLLLIGLFNHFRNRRDRS